MKLSGTTVTAFVDELASASPAPGGGSIAALGAALAAGLTSMVGELTVGREKYKDAQEDMEDLRSEGKVGASKLLDLMEKDTDELKKTRSEAMQKAAKGTVEVPMRTLTLCAEIEKMALLAAQKGNANAVTDAGTAGQFARAAAISAAYNVRVNLFSIKDAEYVADARAKVAALLDDIETTARELSDHLEKALS